MTLESLGLDLTVLAGIVGLTETIKKVDKNDALKQFYVYIPMAVAAIGAYLVTDPFDWRQLVINIIVYTGVAGYGYDFIRKTLNNALGKKKSNTRN